MITALCMLLCATMATTPLPRDALVAELILIEVAQHGEMNKSASMRDAGQCRRFQANAFEQAAAGYRLPEYPDVALYLPMDHAADSDRPTGSCWDMPDAATGNAFEEVARFDYDPELTPRENRAEAAVFLSQVRAGDMMQMLARYSSGGRGTHTILFTRPYDPRTGMLYWADSNFSNTRIDGVRYAYVRANQTWTVEEVARWLGSEGNNGATLYRVRADVERIPAD